MNITPEVFRQVKAIYQQKNSLLRFRVLRLQRELREARETLASIDFSISDTQMTQLKLRHEVLNSPPGSANDIVRLNHRVSQIKQRINELNGIKSEILQKINGLEEAIPLCNKQEVRNNIRCDFLENNVTEPQEDAA